MKGTTHTAQRAKMIFGQEMNPCPQCGGYHIRYQTPIRMLEEITGTESPRQILGKYARATRDGATPLKGPVFLMCFDCGHKGPALDCSGRTSEEVGRDPVVAKEVKRLWNEQPGAGQ